MREREMQRVSKYIAALSGIKHRVWHMNIADPEEGGGGGAGHGLHLGG